MVSSTPKVPKSPWMPFPVLLDAIRDQVPPTGMDVIKTYYEQFRVCTIDPLDGFRP